jgi:quinol monooxygenase YgiN
MADTVKMVAIMTAAPGKKAELQAVMEEFVKATKQEPGCLEFTLHQSLDDDQVLIMTELWADQAALDAHFVGASVEKVKQADMGALVVGNQMHHLRMLA